MTTNQLDLDAILALADAATEEPWLANDRIGVVTGPAGSPLAVFGGGEQDRADAAFVAAARTSVPALAAEVRRLRAEQPEAKPDAIHTHFGLSYANYLVLPRTLLQSMPDAWQTKFVALLDELHEAFAHVPQAEAYKVEAATEHIVGEMGFDLLEEAGIDEHWYDEPVPEDLSPFDLAEWKAEHEKGEPTYYDRNGNEVDPHSRVLLPAEDPVPHYNRGRTRIEPAAARPAAASEGGAR